MKKLSFLLLLLPFLFVSCSSRSDENYSSKDLEGYWAFQKISIQEIQTSDDLLTKSIEEGLNLNESKLDVKTVLFTSKDNKVEYTFDDGTEPKTGYFNIDGNNLIVNLYDVFGNPKEFFNGKISVSKDDLIIYADYADSYQKDLREAYPDSDVQITHVMVKVLYKRIK